MSDDEASLLIICTYFKDSGKYYAHGEYLLSMQTKRMNKLIYPRDIGEWLRENKTLPGLISGTWPGYFTCKVHGQYTELVLPLK